MRKIQLTIDDLSVESFHTADAKGQHSGTVRGYDSDYGCNSELSNCATCLEGCPRDTMTCFASCRMTDGTGPCIDPYC